MKKFLLSGCLALSVPAFAQVTLFYDNFEDIQTTNDNWVLNVGGSGTNQWVVNNSFAGNGGTIPDIPEQQFYVTNAPYSYYLHIVNTTECDNNGICNANFDPANNSEYYVEMVNNISTLGLNNVSLGYEYICGGEDSVSYGNLEYTTDDGVTWNNVNPAFDLVGTNGAWAPGSVADMGINNQASVRFRFHWRNTGGGGVNPGLGIDEFFISGDNPWGQDSIHIVTLGNGSTTYCAGDEIEIEFLANGAFNANNVFSVELSNPNGVFFAPTTIGGVPGGNGTHTVTATLPMGLPFGTGYRIRVVSSEEWIQGANNGTDITINPAAVAGVAIDPFDATICEGSAATLTAVGAANATYTWSPAATLSDDHAATVEATPATSTTYTLSGSTPASCSNSVTFDITAEDCAGIHENAMVVLSVYPNPAAYMLHLQYATLEAERIELLNAAGAVIATYGNGTESINTSGLASGSYLVRLTHAGGTTTARFIK